MELIKNETKSCYIHIPFCKNICSYCDFCKIFYNKKLVNEYLDTLNKEINDKYKNETLKTIYIGGGTPSVLSIDELKKLFEILIVLKREKDYEFTIECNFDSITKEKLLLFKDFEINRLSFGLETTKQETLKLINRTIDINYVKEIINFSKQIGLDNINIDLMYGFPNQELIDLKKDIDFILSLDVKHISTYSLIIEKNTKFYIDNIKNISDDLDSNMYYFIHDQLLKHGYKHYEISNYSKDNYYSKHNLVYWNNEYYYGFGVSASSYIINRCTNTRSITKYIEDYKRVIETETLNNNDIMTYEVILRLRTSNGIDLDDFYNKFNVELTKVFNITNLLNDGYLIIKENKLKVPYKYWYVINNILIKIMEVNNG